MSTCYIDPPNQPMNRTFSPPIGPTLYKDHICLDFETNSDRLLIGTTNATASFWTGSLQLFSSFKDYQAGNHERHYNSSIIFDAKFLDNNRQLISEAECKLKILTLPEDGQCEEGKSLWSDCVEHYEAIRSICLWPRDTTKALTASDNHITIWDTQTSCLKPIDNSYEWHTATITAIDTKKQDVNMFVSSGRDRRALIWDLRTKANVQEVYNNEFCAITSVAWNPIDENTIIVGMQAGNLYTLDVRQPKEIVGLQHCYKRAIEHLEFDNMGKNQLAIVGETNELHVYTCKNGEFELAYKNTEAQGYLQDAKWHDSMLFTCGLDTPITKHVF